MCVARHQVCALYKSETNFRMTSRAFQFSWKTFALRSGGGVFQIVSSFFLSLFLSLSLPPSIVKNSDVGKFRIRAEFEIFQTSVNFARERMRANLKYPRVKGRIVLVLRETNF